MRLSQFAGPIIAAVTVGTAASAVDSSSSMTASMATASLASVTTVRPAAAAAAADGGSRGSRSGAGYYSLSVVGVPAGGFADATTPAGAVQRIYINLPGSTRINLRDADLTDGQFRVLDANGTDVLAAFQLPSPDRENHGFTQYSVFARALGKAGRERKAATKSGCLTDERTRETYCATGQMVLVRDRAGSPSSDNVSRDLLYAFVDVDRDGRAERTPLFSEPLHGLYWGYDDAGRRIAHLRFYQITTDGD